MTEFEKLISDIQCEMTESQLFTQTDIDNINLCLIDEKDPSSESLVDDKDENDQTDAVNCIKEIESIASGVRENSKKTLRYQVIISKLEELYDNLIPIYEYKKTRLTVLENFLKTNIQISQPNISKINLVKVFSSYSSNKISSAFDPIRVTLSGTTPTFEINIKSLKEIKYKDYEDKEVKIYLKKELKDPKIITSLKKIKVFAYEDKTPLPGLKEATYKMIIGHLYMSEKGYPGYYWKLADPMARLFTLEERGLSRNSNDVDPTLTTGATIEDNNGKFYISNLEKHEKFYQSFTVELPKRINIERTQVFIGAIAPTIDSIRTYATYEAYVAIKARTAPLKITEFKETFTELDTRMKLIRVEIDRFQGLIKELDPESQIKKIKCFSKFDFNDDGNPCAAVMSFLGSDPTGFKSMTSGASSGNPDFTMMCYWKQFAKCVNKVGLIPLPGDKLKNIKKLRYWPVGLIIPTPAKLIKIPFPHIWKPLVIMTSSAGTMVVFLAQCGIVPSPFVFIISNSGSKNFVITVNGPQANMGYDLDSDLNQDGSAGPLFKSNLKLPLRKLSHGIKSPIIDFTGTLNSSDTPESLVDDFTSKAIKAIDAIGDIRMEEFNNGVSNIEEGIKAVRIDAIKAVNRLKLGTIKFPKDSGKLKFRKNGIQEVIDEMNDLSKRGEKLKDDTHFKVKHTINRFIKDVSSIDINIEIPNGTQEKINEEKKKILLKFSTEVFKMAKGQKTRSINPKSINKNQLLKDVSETIELAADAHKSFMSNDVKKMIKGMSIDLFNPFKKCCTNKGFEKTVTIDPSVILLLTTVEQSIASIINSIKSEDLNRLKVDLPNIKGFFTKKILRAIPDINLPKSIDIFNASSVLNMISPTLKKISIPQVPFTSVPGLPSQVTIDVGSILKPIMIKILNETNIIEKTLTPSILSVSGQITSANIKACMKNVILSAQIDLNSKVQVFTKIVSKIKSVNGASKTIIDEGFPVLKIKAEANAVIKSLKKRSDLLNVVDDSLIKSLMLTTMPAFDKAMKLPGSHIPIMVLAALEKVNNARKYHPIMNQDDIPSWERLTVKNPLFVIFLDRFCSVAADCTGIILGRSWG